MIVFNGIVKNDILGSSVITGSRRNLIGIGMSLKDCYLLVSVKAMGPVAAQVVPDFLFQAEDSKVERRNRMLRSGSYYVEEGLPSSS